MRWPTHEQRLPADESRHGPRDRCSEEDTGEGLIRHMGAMPEHGMCWF
jgi:hypothetical protein